MEIDDDIQTQGGFKFPSIRGGVEITDGDSSSNKKMASRFGDWPSSSSRIVRVSRTSGGKDRHSKVLTSRGPRDRRIRLSVATAIQFYDLQDRLGYDQPSKAVEWLLQAASTSIDELPSINSPFPETPKQISDGKRSSPEPDPDPELEEEEPIFHQQQQQQQQHVSISKSTTCSSTNSETSKGSGLSLSRCATRVRARERARGRTGEKDKGKEHRSLISDTSFTELLSSGMDKYHNSPQESNLLKKPTRQGQGQGQWSTSPMDCFATGFSGSSSSSSSVGFSSQIHMANSNNNNTTFPISMSVSPFNVDHHHHLQEQHFSLLPDISPSTGVGGEYNLNFKISPASFSGYSRGTLQSNSQSLSTMPPHLQRFSHIDGSNLPLFIGTASSTSAPGHDNSHHHHHHQFPPALEARSRLHLGYGDGFLHSDHKGKGKN